MTEESRWNRRDLRLDLIRGLALLIIFVDHSTIGTFASFHWIADFTLHRFSFIDAADVFIFLAGYVAGFVYTRKFQSRGFTGCLKDALRRCLQLYLAEATLFLACLGAVDAFRWVPVSWSAEILRPFREVPFESAVNVLTFRNQPPLLGILPLYIVFVALTPLAIYLASTKRWLLMCGMAGSYLLAQGAVIAHYPLMESWFFNPFAWEIVFFSALLLGHRTASQPGWWNHRRDYLWRGALGGLGTIALIRLAPSKLIAALLHTQVLVNFVPRVIPYTEKHNLEPLRLVNLTLWVIVVAAMDPEAFYLSSRVGTALVRCGQSSLAVYWTETVLNYLGYFVIVFPAKGVPAELAWILMGLAVLAGVGYLWTNRNTVPWLLDAEPLLKFFMPKRGL